MRAYSTTVVTAKPVPPLVTWPPSYDAAVVGVPQRMHEYNRRTKIGEI